MFSITNIANVGKHKYHGLFRIFKVLLFGLSLITMLSSMDMGSLLAGRSYSISFLCSLVVAQLLSK